MKKQYIKKHLKKYSIYDKRRTTINHAFASALSVPDDYDEEVLNKALMILGQNPEDDLLCAYCDKPAQTWDHIIGLVKDGEFSGYGHQIGNLLPCCKNCNSSKGNKEWNAFLENMVEDENVLMEKKIKISSYIKENSVPLLDIINEFSDDLQEYYSIKSKIFDLMKEADIIASDIRSKVKKRKQIITKQKDNNVM